jgi:hypothetical protein
LQVLRVEVGGQDGEPGVVGARRVLDADGRERIDAGLLVCCPHRGERVGWLRSAHAAHRTPGCGHFPTFPTGVVVFSSRR